MVGSGVNTKKETLTYHTDCHKTNVDQENEDGEDEGQVGAGHGCIVTNVIECQAHQRTAHQMRKKCGESVPLKPKSRKKGAEKGQICTKA